jgi:hypothetical protein
MKTTNLGCFSFSFELDSEVVEQNHLSLWSGVERAESCKRQHFHISVRVDDEHCFCRVGLLVDEHLSLNHGLGAELFGKNEGNLLVRSVVASHGAKELDRVSSNTIASLAKRIVVVAATLNKKEKKK